MTDKVSITCVILTRDVSVTAEAAEVKDKMCPMFGNIFLLLSVSYILRGCNGDTGCPADEKKDWSYDSNLPNGPEHWGEKYPQCNGKMQSPININFINTNKYEASSKPLHRIRYDKPITKFNLENTGYTVEVSPKDGVSRAIQIKGHTYSLESFHFHWGKYWYEGAEHNLNGKSAAIELHLVHRDTSGNYAVLGVLSYVSSYENPGLTSIVNNLLKVKYAKDKTEVDGSDNRSRQINLSKLLPHKSSYYIYTGSLTTPPCSPNVTWVVYKHKSYLDHDQIEEFRQLSSTTKKEGGDDENCNLVNNFRPIQKRNERKIFFFKHEK